ncbi:type 1 glutamine amidotransferase domain-containing protein [Flavobacterium sp.]|uniref:type 1 glutamine amidotransferase domain-containing protein n=1 Tax=Flavobacterium sp. TaxID=239 RepID=UPI00286D7849|nr:type 1 glutamine amidotransferase domain-containing protein [Flavobacterium sp.]
MKIVIVLTSHSKLGNTEGKTGFWIEEFATPYYLFQESGVKITLASPEGGQPPIDPKSDTPENQTESTIRYKKDKKLLELMANTTKLQDISATNFDAIFYPGGHGPLWDLATDKNSIKLIEDFWDAKKPVATVCHSPSVLLNVKDEDGEYLVKGKKVTGFSNTEEQAVQLDKIVPFLLEDELKNKGGIYSKKEDWASYVVKDGLLITGQNPASSGDVAKELLTLLNHKK